MVVDEEEGEEEGEEEAGEVDEVDHLNVVTEYSKQVKNVMLSVPLGVYHVSSISGPIQVPILLQISG